MRKIIVLFLCFMLFFGGFTYAIMTTETTYGSEEYRFEEVYHQGFKTILVDRETGVMYLCVKDHSSSYGGGQGLGMGITVMLNSNGKPLIWEESNENNPRAK